MRKTRFVIISSVTNRGTCFGIINSVRFKPFITIIIIMEICKAPTLRLKALNKHTHIMYIEMEMLSN